MNDIEKEFESLQHDRAPDDSAHAGAAADFTPGAGRLPDALREERPLRFRAGGVPEHLSIPLGSNETCREYPLDEYLPDTPANTVRRETIGLGCVGVVLDRIGQHWGMPSMHTAFSDWESHRIMKDTEERLEPIEIANANLMFWRKKHTQVAELARDPGNHGEYFVAWNDKKTGAEITLGLAEALPWLAGKVERAAETAKDRLAAISGSSISDMMAARHAAKAAGNERIFRAVRGHAEKLNEVFGSAADTADVTRLIQTSPELSPVHGIENYLPLGEPRNLEAVIVYKDLWGRFPPHPSTNRVDMSRDLHQGKPGCMIFNYAFYDPRTDDWWGADHDHSDPEFPMTVMQMSHGYLWEPVMDYNTSVFGIEIALKSR